LSGISSVVIQKNQGSPR